MRIVHGGLHVAGWQRPLHRHFAWRTARDHRRRWPSPARMTVASPKATSASSPGAWQRGDGDPADPAAERANERAGSLPLARRRALRPRVLDRNDRDLVSLLVPGVDQQHPGPRNHRWRGIGRDRDGPLGGGIGAGLCRSMRGRRQMPGSAAWNVRPLWTLPWHMRVQDWVAGSQVITPSTSDGITSGANLTRPRSEVGTPWRL